MIDVDKTERSATAERTALAGYLRKIRRIPLLSCEEELALAERVAHGDPEAERRMVEANDKAAFDQLRAHVEPAG